MEKIIFLDIDGVLNDNISKISLDSIIVLKEIRDIHKAKIVIISSLQLNGNQYRRNQISENLKKYGIYDLDFIDPNFEGNFLGVAIPSRVLGIVDYLKKIKDCCYVILDDDYHNDYKLLGLNYYQTKKWQGLTIKDLEKIFFKKATLNNFKHLTYSYRQLGEYEKITNDLVKVLRKIYFKKNY